jgi:hypothetical protein
MVGIPNLGASVQRAIDEGTGPRGEPAVLTENSGDRSQLPARSGSGNAKFLQYAALQSPVQSDARGSMFIPAGMGDGGSGNGSPGSKPGAGVKSGSDGPPRAYLHNASFPGNSGQPPMKGLGQFGRVALAPPTKPAGQSTKYFGAYPPSRQTISGKSGDLVSPPGPKVDRGQYHPTTYGGTNPGRQFVNQDGQHGGHPVGGHPVGPQTDQDYTPATGRKWMAPSEQPAVGDQYGHPDHFGRNSPGLGNDPMLQARERFLQLADRVLEQFPQFMKGLGEGMPGAFQKAAFAESSARFVAQPAIFRGLIDGAKSRDAFAQDLAKVGLSPQDLAKVRLSAQDLAKVGLSPQDLAKVGSSGQDPAKVGGHDLATLPAAGVPYAGPYGDRAALALQQGGNAPTNSSPGADYTVVKAAAGNPAAALMSGAVKFIRNLQSKAEKASTDKAGDAAKRRAKGKSREVFIDVLIGSVVAASLFAIILYVFF